MKRDWIAACLSLCLAAALAVRWTPRPTGEIVGWIVGLSMAPRLLGQHARITCPACRFPFAFPLDSADEPLPSNRRSQADWTRTGEAPAGELTCPNCGRSATAGAATIGQADCVRVSQHGDDRQPLRRWQIVVLRQRPDEPEGAVTKRLLGLPGEQVTLKDGDLWIDGRRADRPWEIAREMMVPVHDDRYRASGDEGAPGPGTSGWPQACRWRPATANSDWQSTSDSYRFERAVPADGRGCHASHDWLVFHPVSPLPLVARQRNCGGIITDDSSFATGRPRRLFPVRDGALRARVLAPAAGPTAAAAVWAARFMTRTETWIVDADVAAGMMSVYRDGQRWGAFHVDALDAGQFEWIVCDGRHAGYWNMRQVWEAELAEGAAVEGAWSLGAVQGTVTVTDAQLWRDLHYYVAETWGAETSFRLADQELFLIGDNVPASWDSRQGGLHATTADVIGTLPAGASHDSSLRLEAAPRR